MKEYIESFKTALYQIATTFLFFVPTLVRDKRILLWKLLPIGKGQNRVTVLTRFFHFIFNFLCTL